VALGATQSTTLGGKYPWAGVFPCLATQKRGGSRTRAPSRGGALCYCSTTAAAVRELGWVGEILKKCESEKVMEKNETVNGDV